MSINEHGTFESEVVARDGFEIGKNTRAKRGNKRVSLRKRMKHEKIVEKKMILMHSWIGVSDLQISKCGKNHIVEHGSEKSVLQSVGDDGFAFFADNGAETEIQMCLLCAEPCARFINKRHKWFRECGIAEVLNAKPGLLALCQKRCRKEKEQRKHEVAHLGVNKCVVVSVNCNAWLQLNQISKPQPKIEMKPLILLHLALLPLSLFGQEVKALCEKTDEQLSARNLAEAKRAIEEAYKLAPKDYDVLCRYSRVLVLFGDEQKESEQEKIYLRALELAEEAVAVNPKHALGYVRRAAARGKVALFKGVLSVADMVKATRDDAEKAIQLNNAGEQGLATAHYILGRTHLKLTEQPKVVRKPLGLDWGNLDDALLHLKKATELRKGYIMFHLDYARALAKKKQRDEAKKELTAISQLQPTEFGDETRKQEAFALLSELK